MLAFPQGNKMFYKIWAGKSSLSMLERPEAFGQSICKGLKWKQTTTTGILPPSSSSTRLKSELPLLLSPPLSPPSPTAHAVTSSE